MNPYEKTAIFIRVNPLKDMDVISSTMLKETFFSMKKNRQLSPRFSSYRATLHTLCDHIVTV